jgi:iron-only hydrogenase group A
MSQLPSKTLLSSSFLLMRRPKTPKTTKKPNTGPEPPSATPPAGATAAPPAPAPPKAAAPAAPTAAATPSAANAPAHWQQALAEIANKKSTGKIVVAQIAPAVRVAISEALGKPPGSVKTGQMVAGLRRLGFDYVFDTLFGADLTIMEEGTELLERLAAHLEQAKKERDAAAGQGDAAAASAPPPPMPMFTSCCPGWIAMVEKSNPELIPYLSTCKSPQMMLGAVIKNYFAASANVPPEKVVGVSIMPCVRKQGEADRPWFATTGVARDVDHVITTVELAKAFNEAGIDPETLEEEEFDSPLGEGSGGGQLFGTTGGVMEAALRTVAELVTGKPMDKIVYDEVRGLEGIREATISLQPGQGTPFYELMMPGGGGEGAAPPPLEIRVAVANGLGNAKKLIKAMKDGEARFDFAEVMACPGGCISGGGQPRSADKQIANTRQAAIFALDEKAKIRRPHENEFIQRLYANYLGGRAGHGKAHELFHTHYVAGGVEGAE